MGAGVLYLKRLVLFCAVNVTRHNKAPHNVNHLYSWIKPHNYKNNPTVNKMPAKNSLLIQYSLMLMVTDPPPPPHSLDASLRQHSCRCCAVGQDGSHFQPQTVSKAEELSEVCGEIQPIWDHPRNSEISGGGCYQRHKHFTSCWRWSLLCIY